MSRYKLRFFFDAGSGICLWSADERTIEKFDYPVDPSKLPIDENLRRRLHYVTAWYDTSMDWTNPSGPTPWKPDEIEQFERATNVLLQDLQKALHGDFEIVDPKGS